jgi:hypothetical protein
MKEIKLKEDFIYLCKKEQRPLAIVLTGVGRGSKGRYGGGDLTNVQYKPI